MTNITLFQRQFDDPHELIALTEVPSVLAMKTHLDSVRRWATAGVGDPPVRLASVKIGGRRFTTPQKIVDFVERRLSSGICESADSRAEEARDALRRALQRSAEVKIGENAHHKRVARQHDQLAEAARRQATSHG